MSNVLEILSLHELNERETNLLNQLKKVKDEIKKRSQENDDEISKPEKKIRIKIKK